MTCIIDEENLDDDCSGVWYPLTLTCTNVLTFIKASDRGRIFIQLHHT